MIVTYLLPTVWAGKVPMQYRIEKRKKDMRTNFCKMYHKYEVSDSCLEHMLVYCDDARLKGDRIIVTNGEAAAKVFHWLFGKWEDTQAMAQEASMRG